MNTESQEKMQNRRLKKLSSLEGTPNFFQIARFTVFYSTPLFCAMIVNMVLDIVPLYKTFSLVTKDSLVMLWVLTIGLTLFFVIASYFFGGVIEQRDNPPVIIAAAIICAFLPQIFVLFLRFTIKNELFPQVTGGILDMVNQSEVHSKWIESSDIMVCLLCLVAVCSTLAVAYLAYIDKKEKKFLKYQLRQQLIALSEIKTEIKKEILLKEQIIRDFNGVVREAVESENEKYEAALDELVENRLAHLNFARMKLAQNLGEPDAVNYLSKQLPKELQDFHINRKANFRVEDFLRLDHGQFNQGDEQN